MNSQNFSDLIGTATIQQIDNDEQAGSQTRIATLPQLTQQPLLDVEANLRQNQTHGNSLSGADAPVKTQCWEFPFSFTSMGSGKAKTCS
jgi:hypothetical protein